MPYSEAAYGGKARQAQASLRVAGEPTSEEPSASFGGQKRHLGLTRAISRPLPDLEKKAADGTAASFRNAPADEAEYRGPSCIVGRELPTAFMLSVYLLSCLGNFIYETSLTCIDLSHQFPIVRST